MKTFELDILTPDEKIFSGMAQSVQVPGTKGSFQILINHAPIISSLGDGPLKIVQEDGEELRYHTRNGVVEVLKNKVIVLVGKVVRF